MRTDYRHIDVGEDSCAIVENPRDSGRQIAFDLHSRNPPSLSRHTRRSFHQTTRDVVSITALALDCVTRRQPFAVVVEQLGIDPLGLPLDRTVWASKSSWVLSHTECSTIG